MDQQPQTPPSTTTTTTTSDTTPTTEPVLTEKQLERKRRKEEAAKAARAKLEAKAKAKADAAAAKSNAPSATSTTSSSDSSSKPDPKPKKEKFLKKEFVNLTPKGHKKDVSTPMAAAYDPPAVEAAWYDWWEAQGYFQPIDPEGREKFVIVIPPPNVTGALHLGHALTNSIQDVLIRWHRMLGHSVLWLPGIDHAGIATQVRVEKKLWAEQGKTRHDIGRENFIKMIWEWKNEYGGQIQNQLRRLGSSLDWNREVFTLDEKLSTAVVEAFCRWFDDGKIYRATRLVHWCCTLNTAISDCEVEHKEYSGRTLIKVPGYDELVEVGTLTSFAYKVVDSDEEIVVATTRPETMLGDTAVAVHPDDERYQHLHGKLLKHPFVDRLIPIITDGILVDKSFGTGAVKVTPSHDPKDYECGIRNKLPFINILNHNGTINENGGRFAGLKRFTARVKVTEALEELGLLRGKADNPMAIAKCSRSDDIIEPLIMPQWYVNCQEIGKQAADAVRDGSLEIIPKSQESRWFYFMDDIRDWCISRQLWWGHRIPAYYVSIEGQAPFDRNATESYVCGRSEAEALQRACAKFNVDASKVKLEQDEDVLDTWFSSGLFPFSTMGWPNTEHADFKAFYPTSLLETGWDILFFWVARMVMMGLSFTNQLPFKQVFLHAMIRDAQGRKMSKSKGNVIDPIWVMEGATLEQLNATLEGGVLDEQEKITAKEGQQKNFPNGIGECGTDAMRLALCDYTQQDKDINLDISRVESFRAFCNKMWNATKFVLMQLGNNFVPVSFAEMAHAGPERNKMEQWILSRLNAAIVQSNEGLGAYHFSKSTTACHGFWLYEFCDVFVECTKALMTNATQEQQHSIRNTLYTCLEVALRLIHPFMPFVTEELWQRIPRRPGDTTESIMIAPYPLAIPEWENNTIEKEVSIMMNIIQAIRSLRAQYKLQAKSRPQLWVRSTQPDRLSIVTALLPSITAIGGCGSSASIDESGSIGSCCAMRIVDDITSVYLNLEGLVDIPKEIEKLRQLVKSREASIAGLQKRMNGPTYSSTPDEVKAQDAEKISKMEVELDNARLAIIDYEKML